MRLGAGGLEGLETPCGAKHPAIRLESCLGRPPRGTRPSSPSERGGQVTLNGCDSRLAAWKAWRRLVVRNTQLSDLSRALEVNLVGQGLLPRRKGAAVCRVGSDRLEGGLESSLTPRSLGLTGSFIGNASTKGLHTPFLYRRACQDKVKTNGGWFHSR